MNFKPLSVGDLVFEIKSSLESRFRQVVVEGEVSNISKTVAGHIYFTLSDQRASLSCALFRGDAMRNSSVVRKLKDGDHIVVTGSIGVYAKRGVFQVVAKRIAPAGKGNLALQFELLKEKLAKQGFFDASNKKPIPKFPKRIAVITAPYGAALQDFLKVFKRRSLWCDVVIVPAIVQGESSARSLTEALLRAQELEDIDVIVLTRGGGAMEDLWSLNDEKLIEHIYECHIPVISAVGHQVDTTLSDYAADLRLETPSAAAEYLSQPHTEIMRQLDGLGQMLKSFLYKHQSDIQKRLERINPVNLARGIQMRINEFKYRLSRIDLARNEELYLGLQDKEMRASELLERAKNALEQKLEKSKNRVDLSGQLLRSIDPKNVLNRGYSYVQSESGVIAKMSDYDKLDSSETFTIHFSDGKGKAKKV